MHPRNSNEAIMSLAIDLQECRPIHLMLNGEAHKIENLRPDTPLLQLLRGPHSLTGTKEGCAEGDCGACTVVLGRMHAGQLIWQPVNTCIMLLPMVDKSVIRTVEGVAKEDGTLHPVQQAMVEHHGSQCGFCTPGFVMSLYGGWLNRSSFSASALDDLLAGNLCRCTGYGPIIRAGQSLAGQPLAKWEIVRLDNEKAYLKSCETLPELIYATKEASYVAPLTKDGFSQAYLKQPEAQIIAGATDVGLWITKQNRKLPAFISVKDVDGLDDVTEQTDGFHIGAAATHNKAADLLAAHFPSLKELWRRFGSVQVRASGTVGGNIANGSPIGDLAPAFIALNSDLILRRGTEERRLKLEDFFLSYGQQDRQKSEWVDSLFVPKLSRGWKFNCYKLSRRFDQDISAVMGAFALKTEGSKITAARIAFGGMAGVPQRARSLEKTLIGQALEPNKTDDAAIDTAIAADFKPLSDVRASAEFRLLGARNLLQKCRLEMAEGKPLRLAGDGLLAEGLTPSASSRNNEAAS